MLIIYCFYFTTDNTQNVKKVILLDFFNACAIKDSERGNGKERVMANENQNIQYLSEEDASALMEQALQVFPLAFQFLGSDGQNALNRALGNLYWYGEELLEQAAALYCKVVRAHSFNDGNKRFALLAMDVFLIRNGVLLKADPSRYRVMKELGDRVATHELDHKSILKHLVLSEDTPEPMSLMDAIEHSLARWSEVLRELSKR